MFFDSALAWRSATVILAMAFGLGACGTNTGDGTGQSAGRGGSSSQGGAQGLGGSFTGGTNATSGGVANVAAGTANNSGGIGNLAGAGSEVAGAATEGGAAAAAGGAGGMSTGAWTFPAGVTKPRIMIVGDSISAGPGCYKKYLLKDLTDNGYSKFEFVGEYTDDCGGGVMHSAVSCSNAEQYTHDMFMMPNCQQGKSFLGLAPLAAKHEPDLIMLQLGVNDVWGGTPTQTTLARYKTLVEQARAQNPDIAVVVAQIQKIRPDCGTDDSVQKRAEELVMAVPAWAQQLNTAKAPVFVADLWTNSDWSMAETLDCVHPNEVGAQRMGMNWFNALKKILTPG
jgi:hypothetical protein